MQCLSCQKVLVYVNLKVPDKAPPKLFCTGCGTKILSRIGGYYHCTNCKETSLCSSCKICPNGHFLSRVLFLNEKGPNLYAQNKYNCDCCQITVSNKYPGVYHCIECEFDICENCLGKTEMIIKNLDDI